MRQFVPEQAVSSCSLFTQVPVAGEALDWAERLRFIKPQVSSEHWLRRLSEWLRASDLKFWMGGAASR